MNNVVPTDADKQEWYELATWAYSERRNKIGHRYSMAAAYRNGEEMDGLYYHYLKQGVKFWRDGAPKFIPDYHATS